MTTVIVTNPAPSTYPSLNEDACKKLGIAQLVLGCLAFVLEIILIAIVYLTQGQGIWAGIFVIVAGALAVSGSKSKSRGIIIGCAVLSIIAAILSVIAFILAFMMAAGMGILGWTIYAALEGISGVLFLVEVAVAIAQTVICFRPVCCPPPQAATTTATTTVYNYPGTQPVQPAPGYAGQPQPGYPGQPQPGYPPQPGYGYPPASGQPPAYNPAVKQ